ncbi:hypothetical protein [Lichenicoccus sp.]|uniref:hypothetical protein n=1 Tax=Lichenicoccus sp. TaxID=2781899 RepID=UPI003D0A6D8D
MKTTLGVLSKDVPMRLCRSFKIIPLIMCIMAAGPHQPDHARGYFFKGTLGLRRVELLIVADNNRVVSGTHYFTGDSLRDIPLDGSIGDHVILRAPTGGVFDLNYTRKEVGTPSRDPIDFYNSAGLTGSWKEKGKVLPVTLLAGGYTNGPWPKRLYDDVTDESDADFEHMVQGFYHAVLTNDRDQTSRYIDFPLRVNVAPVGKNRSPPRHWTVASAADLKSNWNKIFPRAWLESVAMVFPHDMASIQGMAMLGPGLAWFGPNGARVINLVVK